MTGFRCEECGSTAAKTPKNKRFCTRVCADKARRKEMKKQWLITPCEGCGKPFSRPQWKRDQRFCSKQCSGRVNAQIAVEKRKTKRPRLTCEHCGKSFTVPPSHHKQRFCSRSCRYTTMRGDKGANAGGGQHMRGQGNPRWRGGVALDERTRQPWQAKLGQWRRRVFHRDTYTCQRCGLSPKTKNQLRSHHVAPWATNPDRRFDVANGITLCRACHDWVHSPENSAAHFLS